MGVGVALLIPHWAIGLVLILTAVGLTWGERLWLCEPLTTEDSK